MSRIVVMKSLTVFLSCFLLITAFSCNQAEEVEVNGTVVQTNDHLKVIKVWGTHEERGFAYGYLMAEEIEEAYTGYAQPYLGKYYSMAKKLVKSPESFKIEEKYLTEAKAMLEGMKAAGIDVDEMDEWDLILFNSLLDVFGFAYQFQQMGNGCSSLMNWGEATRGTDLDGKSVISRHVDWGAEPALVNNNAIVVHIPSEEDEQPWMMVGYAGQIGVLSGVNKSGLGAFQQVVIDGNHGNASFGKQYEPIWFTLRDALEKKDPNQDGRHNVEDIKHEIKQNTSGYADGYIITSIAPSTEKEDHLISMVAEIAPGAPHISIRSTERDDQLPGQNLYSANNQIGRKDANNYCSRYESTINAVGTGKGISAEKNWEILRDSSNCEDMFWDNVQMMQYIPELHRFKLSYYEDGKHAFMNKPVELDLKELFGED